jgi:uncharacterized membrane protein
MEICILKLDGNHQAEEALAAVIDADGDRKPWLHDVAVVARPLIGRVRIGATFPDGKSKTFREGDLAESVADLGAFSGYFVSLLAGPFGAAFRATHAGMAGEAVGREAENKFLHLDQIKKLLERDSSALILIADTKICDEMVKLFESYNPKVVRREVATELRKRLEELHRDAAQELLGLETEGAPATH